MSRSYILWGLFNQALIFVGWFKCLALSAVTVHCTVGAAKMCCAIGAATVRLLAAVKRLLAAVERL